MRKTAAWNVMGVDRSTQTIAEEAARRAGMSLADWLDEVVAEQAAEQGVAAEDLTEDDRLDAIGDRLDQLSRRERGVAATPAPRGRRARPRDETFAPEAPASNDATAEARLEAAIAKLDSRAARNEERTAKALESMAQWIERGEVERARERGRQEAADREARLEAARENARGETPEREIGRRDLDERSAPPARRAEPEGPKSLARSRLDLEDAVQRIQRRRGELDARQGVERRGPPREAADAAPVPTPTSNVAALPVQSREEPRPTPAGAPQTVAVEALREEIAGLKARLDRFAGEREAPERATPAAVPPAPPAGPAPLDRRLTAGETEALRGELAAMRRALGELAPRDAGLLEGAVVDLGRRLEAMRKAAVNADSLRPLEDMLRHVTELLRRQDPRSAVKGVENDLKALSEKIDTLARAAVDPALIDQIRRQTEDVRRMLANAAESLPVAKLERQIEKLAERTERLGSHPAPRPEIERLVAMFGETRTQIERAISPALLKTVEQRLEGLAKRIDEALARPAAAYDARPMEDLARRVDDLRGAVERQATDLGRKLDRPAAAATLDSRPFDELARRVEGLKTAVERQAAVAPANPNLEAALADIGRKLDRPAPAPTLDARPFEELARRVEGLKSAVERQAAVAPTNPKLEAALAEIARKLDRPAPAPALDAGPFEELARRVEGLKSAVERQAAVAPTNPKLEAALAEIARKLDRPAPAPVLDPRPFEDLALRVEGLKSAVERQAEVAPANPKLEAALADIGRKLDRPAPAPTLDAGPFEELARRVDGLKGAVDRQASIPAATARLEVTLAEIGKKLERLAQAPTLDARPIEDLSRRFETLRAAVERQGGPPSANAKLDAALAEIGQKLDRVAQAPTLDARPIEDLSRRLDGLKTAFERQAASLPSTAKLEAELGEIGRKLERLSAAPTFDPGPIEDLSRRLDGLRIAFERQAPTARLEAELAEIGKKLERVGAPPAFDPRPILDLSRRFDGLKGVLERLAANAPSTAKLEAELAEIGRALERVSAAPSFDPRPLEELSRRFDALGAAVERQAATAPSTAKIEAELAEIGRKLERIGAPPALDTRPIEDLSRRFEGLRTVVERQAAATPASAKLEAELAEIGRKLERVAAAPTFDASPIEELTRRFDGLKSAVERQASIPASTARLEAGLAEIGLKLERLATAATPDPRPIEDLSRRFGSLQGALERQAAAPPSTAKLEAGLAEIGLKLERLATAPTLDTRPIEELSRRFDSLKSAVERQAAAAPANASIEAALADLGRKLDRPAPVFDARPIEDLAQRIEGLRAAVEHQAEGVALGEKLEGAITEIGRKLDRPQQGLADQMAIKSTLQALAARVEEGFRKIGSAPPDSARSVGALELELLDEIARRLEEMRGAMERHGDFGASAIRLEAAIADLSSRMESASEPASDRAALNETLQLLISRLRDWGPASATADSGSLDALTARIEALHASVEGHSEIAPRLSDLSAELAEIRQRLPAQGQSEEDARALLDVVQELSDKIDRQGASNADARAMETLAREVLSRPMRVDTSAIESMIVDLGHRMDATAAANFDLAPLVDWMARIDTRLEAVDPAPIARAVRDLGERFDAREPAALDPRQIEEAATLIARRLEPASGLGADAELLLQHLAEIHDRLDTLGGAAGSSAALEKSVADLAAEFENTRELLASVVEPAALASGIVDDLADMKTEQASAERRMSTRLTRVQEILEQLSDRLRHIEEGQNARAAAGQAPVPPQPSPPASGGFDFNDIPDRPRGAAGRVAAASAPLPPARPATDTTGLLLEPGAGAPRGKGKKPDEPPRPAEDEEASKPTDLQAHIAAARRAAMAEMNARREQANPAAEGAPKRVGAPMAALKQAQGVVANRRVPFLVGATLLVAAATAAIYELRGGHLPLIQKSELAPGVESPVARAPAVPDAAPAPTADAAPKDAAPAPPAKIDFTPTGAVGPGKAPESAVKPAAAGAKAPADLVAAIPEGQPDALKAAAIAGDPSAETEMGLRYVEGRGLARDAKIGARWLELAANQGVVYAQYRIGALYERGVGVAKDGSLARAWYKKAADGGNARAMHNLAVMDAEDAGAGKPDYAEAAQGFRGAGQLGIHDSQYNLGVLYGRGLGVPQDLPQAWMWFSLAAQQGDADAAKKRDEVAARLDAAQIAAAAKLLADFKPRTPSPAANEAPQPPGGWEPKAQAAKPTAPAASPAPAAPATKS